MRIHPTAQAYIRNNFSARDRVSDTHVFNPRNRVGLVLDPGGGYLMYTHEGTHLNISSVEVPREQRRQGRASRMYDQMYALHGDLPTDTVGRSRHGEVFRAAYDARRR